MKAVVKEYKVNEKIVFNYLTNIIDGHEEPVEYPDNYEAYTFTQINPKEVKLEIELCLPLESVPYMDSVWPNAISNIKEIFNN